MADNSITLTLGFEDTDFTRQLKFENLPDTALVVNTLKSRILAVNESLSAGTAGGLSTFFLSDEGDNFIGIVAAKTDSVTETVLNITD